ncbi:UDP-glucose 6-dehydrogenase [Halioglobus japonicus]|uniref:UDP-glucose 6-dehydrogenase n=1 Tax=Halioglobus japonicus TaxID=930805 RepID=A0AAP8MGF3_9GAMM|nr:UDP-glucose/GDP-mannose dehydrogenase family protein [Halioglobus japonicus]AQA19521.1 UDP-glucose 6-dehydrogenase [Halioglobus japonicus]PLW87415.1 UDP-glucose/GDP-mannose dehydrogenase family protein [Halioglobus japonicus]GHD08600.1 UDP-glucose 6-dehydrogenase [Halioglobus japonicus]
MNVVMIGAGYVGLVSGACFSEFGANVMCIDLDAERVERLAAGEMPIYEPGLENLVERNLDDGRLQFGTDLAAAVSEADLVFIAVGTPTRRGEGYADLSYVYQAARDIAPHLSGYTVVVDKSTVPVGTAAEVKRIISETNPEADFDVASNPEFLREGAAIGDFMRPDRVVLGVESERAERALRELYRPLNLIEAPILVTDLESAELTKYAANAFLATKISFINEISQLCEEVGADVHAVAKGMGLDGRIGKKFLHAGPGYGGSCFPKDTLALVRTAQEYGVSSRIVEAVVEVNAAQKARMVTKIRHALDDTVSSKRIAVLGLTFKPGTDDMRDAPALTILPQLVDRGADIIAHDPQGIDEARELLPPQVSYSDDIYATIEGADAVVLMTEWNAYRGLHFKRVRELMRGNVFVDLRNVYEPQTMRDHGFHYACVGREA